MTTGFGMPDFVASAMPDLFASIGHGEPQPIHHYVGWLEGEPVASSTLFLAAGVAGIWAVATLSEARGQGIDAAMTLIPLRDARAMGYRVGILNASSMGLNMYRRLGFKEYCKVGYYIWAGDNKADTR